MRSEVTIWSYDPHVIDMLLEFEKKFLKNLQERSHGTEDHQIFFKATFNFCYKEANDFIVQVVRNVPEAKIAVADFRDYLIDVDPYGFVYAEDL